MKKILLLSLASLLLFSSCSRITIVHREQWESVIASIDTLQQVIGQLDSSLVELNEHTKSARIEQEFATLRIEEKIGQISRDISESQVRITEISKKTGAIDKHIRESVRQDSLAAVQQKTERDQLFTMALDEFNSARFADADTLFMEFSEKYPDDERVAEALFWRGEAAFAQNKFDEAESIYKQYYSSYIDGEQICTVLFKWGSVYDQRDEKARRDFVWKQLNDHCPNSKEAKMVALQLEKAEKSE